MSYEIRFAPPAIRALSNDLPMSMVDAALALIRGDLAEQPKRVGKPLTAQLAGKWSARRGSYRIIYTIDDDKQLVRIEDIRHRSNSYR